ncbi:MAG: DUF4238 domain-containing protein [Planctomycetes bacterium]|nr:DUF4238 domain-containing protein [Planctomycetota bacterium]
MQTCLDNPTYQHITPRLLLRGFGRGTKRDRKIYRFDKTTLQAELTTVDAVGAECGYYDSIIHGAGASGADGVLTQSESDVGQVLSKIKQTSSLANLSEDEKTSLASYVACHIARTPITKADIQGFVTAADPSTPSSTIDFVTQSLFAGYLKGEAWRNLMPPLREKKWVLVETPRSYPFWLSDSWISFFNKEELRKGNGRINCGLKVRGTELICPISSTLSLWLMCPRSSVSDDYLREIMWDGSGRAAQVKATRVNIFRAFQLHGSERFLYAEINNFDWAIRLLSGAPRLQEPCRNLLFPRAKPHG